MRRNRWVVGGRSGEYGSEWGIYIKKTDEEEEQKIPTEWWITPPTSSPKLEEESERMFKAKAKEI